MAIVWTAKCPPRRRDLKTGLSALWGAADSTGVTLVIPFVRLQCGWSDISYVQVPPPNRWQRKIFGGWLRFSKSCSQGFMSASWVACWDWRNPGLKICFRSSLGISISRLSDVATCISASGKARDAMGWVLFSTLFSTVILKVLPGVRLLKRLNTCWAGRLTGGSSSAS